MRRGRTMLPGNLRHKWLGFALTFSLAKAKGVKTLLRTAKKIPFKKLNSEQETDGGRNCRSAARGKDTKSSNRWRRWDCLSVCSATRRSRGWKGDHLTKGSPRQIKKKIFRETVCARPEFPSLGPVNSTFWY